MPAMAFQGCFEKREPFLWWSLSMGKIRMLVDTEQSHKSLTGWAVIIGFC